MQSISEKSRGRASQLIFFEASITLILKLGKNSIREKTITDQYLPWI